MKVSELMGQNPVIELDHDGEIYRLRITRNRKLILTK
jgi:hemin uptake protein HemP